jgi:hypothetical protein
MEKIIISPPAFEGISAYCIGGLAVLMTVLSVIAYSKGNRRNLLFLSVGAIFWLSSSAFAALSGILARLDILPPPFIVMMVFALISAFAVGCTSFGKTVAENTSWKILIALQCFRLPLEIFMHHAYEKKIMPIQLSYSGYNFDLLTGLGAVILLEILRFSPKFSKQFIWIWNVWGIYCLIAIGVIAVTGSPIIAGFGTEPENLNTWVLFFPYVWLPAVLVVLAVFGHIVITRKLLLKTS